MKDGGSAFPVMDGKYGYDGEYLGLECLKEGMSLRDWFAGQALCGVLACGRYSISEKNSIKEDYAVIAYIFADTMLAEREKAV
jgi:hypothetical protein